MWVFDATPLIYLAKVGRLRLVGALEGPCCVPQPVYDEVVTTGLKAGYPDARRIEQCVDSGHVEVVSVVNTQLEPRLDENPQLSEADVAVLGCAASRGAVAVMDDAAGRRAADIEGIETRGAAYIVLSCAKRGIISVSEARDIIDSMIDAGWYCAPDVYAQLVKKLESFER